MALDPVVRDRLAALAAELAAARQLAVNGVRVVQQGRLPVCEAAMSKVYSGELMQRISKRHGSRRRHRDIGGGLERRPSRSRVRQTLRRSIMMVVGGGTAQIRERSLHSADSCCPAEAC